MIKVLFVCLGNICRSPTAQGVFESMVGAAGLGRALGADSAGTHGYHIGKPPDARATEAAARRGIDLTRYRARRAEAADFETFDLILAMDRENRRALERLVPEGRRDRLRLFLDFAPETGLRDVPDPYYGGRDGFERVLDLIEAGSRGLLAEIRRDYADRLSP